MASRKFWGWGVEGGGLGAAFNEPLVKLAAGLAGAPVGPLRTPPSSGDLRLPPSRVELGDRASVRLGASADPLDRAAHTYGRAYRDVIRALDGDFSGAPDLVLHPSNEAGVQEAIELCAERGFALIPFGGGSSVVGGVEPRGLREVYPGVVSLDLGGLGRVLDIDPLSRTARMEAGILGPALEAALAPHGFTLRHFPQSFEWSSLGGWIATRAGGHFATLETRIDDLVEAVRLLSPAGALETARLPSSGAGPDPKRLLLGSEGALGVITEATVRVRPRPRFRASAAVAFPDFLAGAIAARSIAQSGLHPANCRLLDPTEALVSGARADGRAALLLAFESAELDPALLLARAVELARDASGEPDPDRGARSPDDAAAAWRRLFLNGPYLRDDLARAGLIAETFETACTWSRLAELVTGVMAAVEEAARRECGGALVAVRLTHVYPDGAAPYFTVLAPARRGSEVAQWDAVKEASLDAIARSGGTVTHHHAVGRDHRRAFERERPPLWGAALEAAKRTLDPRGIMNPGALVCSPSP